MTFTALSYGAMVKAFPTAGSTFSILLVSALSHFLGHADERGVGAGAGYTANYPLPHGTQWDTYGPALDAACAVIGKDHPDAVVVSLGVDTYEHDPISRFALTSDDFSRIGDRIARTGRPTLFVMEGGYAVDAIGVNAVNVLSGFEQR